MAKIMVIAGGDWQCPIVKTAKAMGHEVICTNLYEESPAFEFADIKVVANVLDKEKNLEIAEEYRPDVVLTEQTDIAIPTVAYVADMLGIKGIGVDVAERFTNKFKMREYAEKAGISVPKYKLCYSSTDAKAFLKNSPVSIIKPLDSQSSRGIHIVKTEDDIDLYYEDCVKYSNVEKAILIEEYIDGTEFTVDGVKTTTEYLVTAISEKEHYSYNPNVAKRLFFSESNDNYNYDVLRKENECLVKAMGLSFGLTHAEYKYHDGKFYLIEIAARGGGTRISSDIVKLVSGIDTNQLLIRMLLGESETIVKNDKKEYAVLGFFDFKPGLVKEIQGIEEIKMADGVHIVQLDIDEGDYIVNAQDDRSRCGFYIASANTKGDLIIIEKKIKETVKVITE